MDDDRKKFPRKGGSKPAGAGGRDGGAKKFGKPRTEGGAKPFAKKPYAPRPAGAGGGDRPDRPKRDFGPRDGEARPASGERTFNKGPRPEGKPYEKREGKPFGDKPYAKKPFVKRAEGAEGGERPKRDFAPRDGAARAERPFHKGPRPEGKPYEKREGGRSFGGGKPYGDKPYRARPAEGAEGAERPRREFNRDDRPRDGEGRSERPFHKGPRPEGKPYEKREGGRSFGGDKPYGDKPYRARPAEGGDRSFRPRAEGGKPFEKRGEGFKPRPRASEDAPEPGERIAKRLARAGLASRRDAEELIAAGRVKVNNKILASPAVNVMPDDIIHLDGMEIPPIERTRLFLFHKPAGVVTTNRDPEGRKTVFDVLPQELPRLMTIGRLDINTEGLLLLTNDGGLSRVLELPATGWLRRYRVRVHGKVEQKTLDGLKDGIAVEGVFYGSIEATLDREQGSNAWITIGLREGKNREVKNILGALGLEVNRLIRISYGPFQLGELPEGHVQEIKGKMLRDQLGERLIEESGANFDADIVKPFSNKPTFRREERREEEAPRAPRAARLDIGEGGLIKNRKRDRERHREDVLGRLSTERPAGFGDKPSYGDKPKFGDKPRFGDKPKFGDKPRFGDKPKFGGKKGDEREKKPFETPGARKANVWMAPGARPQSEKAKADAASKPRGRPDFDKPRSDKPRFDKPRSDGPRSDKPRSDRPRSDRPSGDGPRGGRPGGPRRDRG
ncbi:pseudouridine synthase [Aminobacter sp. LjRoot7]|uniref:pseudouridine synthase n=1 Tax=Aminobacter sp. LjRoot7 TaxID=3342335 RepID=UPI003ED1121A